MFTRTAAALAAIVLLAGCTAGPVGVGAPIGPGTGGVPGPVSGPAAAGPLAASVRLRLAAPYALQAVVNGHSVADVAQVELQVYRDGSPVSGASTTIAGASLAAPVTLRNLRAATAYEVRATAFKASGAVISDAVASRAAFTTPAVVTTGGVATIDDATVAVPLALALAPRAVPVRLTFNVELAPPLRKKTTHVRISVLAGGTLVSQRLETVAEAAADQTLTNLKLDTSYVIQTEGLSLSPETVYSADAKSSFAFTTPAAGGLSVEDDMNVVLATPVVVVPCSK